MRQTFTLVSIAVLGQSGCAVATGAVAGGDPLFDAGAPLSADAAGVDGPATWTALYTDYFGPSGKANCSSLPTCHGTAGSTAIGTSGFSSGSTKDACWQGMTAGMGCASAIPPCPIVSSGSGQDPTQAGLYKNLRRTSATGKLTGTMPKNGATATAPGYIFTSGDLARIAQWIKEGAQNN